MKKEALFVSCVSRSFSHPKHKASTQYINNDILKAASILGVTKT
jgi:hypothetical protein